MIRKLIVLAGLIAIGVAFWIINPTGRLVLSYSFFALALVYFLFSIIFQGIISRRVKDRKTRYSLSKALTVLYVFIFVGTVAVLWIEQPETLAVSIGLIGAAAAFVLQDFVRNFVGGLAILANDIYSVGDRIEVEEWLGDVVDIGLLYTTLLEMRAWIGGDQTTGRLVTIPNSMATSGIVSNYTKDFPFLWDEVKFPISQDSDIPYAMERFKAIAYEVTDEQARAAEEALTEVVMEKYYLTQREVRPSAYMSFNDDWVDIFVRYVTRVHDRREVRSKMLQLMLAEIRLSERIKIGSDATGIDMFPEITVVHK
ncbi:MAG: mechanosensitive ion channel family protein [Methanomassiliicoccus sp.]|nr:mechanosensitive ion channel family protein [Methanomassiliicoccus sp.]